MVHEDDISPVTPCVPVEDSNFDLNVEIRRLDARAEERSARFKQENDEFLCELKEIFDYLNSMVDHMTATAVYYRKRSERRERFHKQRLAHRSLES